MTATADAKRKHEADRHGMLSVRKLMLKVEMTDVTPGEHVKASTGNAPVHTVELGGATGDVQCLTQRRLAFGNESSSLDSHL